MTATVEPLSWQGDATVIVYAVRYALGRRGSHAAILIGATIRGNVRQLPHGAREAIIRDLTGWLDGAGATAARGEREPWVLALAALGVRRKATRVETPLPPVPVVPVATPARRRRDVRAAS